MASSSTVTLDDLPPTPDAHLFYPTHDDSVPSPEQGTPPPSEQRPLLKDRLYVGNLHPSVDEYTLLQVFSKFGKITKLDWLFHKTGLLKGKPRGYAFVEYANQDDALRALSAAHGKPLRGRTLVVTFAHQAPLDQYAGSGTPGSYRNRKTMMEVGRPTTLSMLKTGMSGRHEGKTKDKIAMMEAKLRQMERTNPRPSTPSSSASPASPSDLTTSSTQPQNQAQTQTGCTPSAEHHRHPTPQLPSHPSLPAKPPPQIPGAPAPVALPQPPPMPLSLSMSTSMSMSMSSSHGSLQGHSGSGGLGKHTGGAGNILPSMKSAALSRGSGSGTGMGTGTGMGGAPQRTAKAPKLVGVKIKHKERDRDRDKEKESAVETGKESEKEIEGGTL